MVQELRAAVTAAADLVMEVGRRFESGDPAEDLLPRLAARLADIERRAILLGPECRGEVDRLLQALAAVVSGGEAWLTRVDGLELASHHLRARVRQAYGIATRPD